MPLRRSRTLFNNCRRSMADAGLATQSPDAIICPLCWKETDVSDLRIEHAVPSELSGTEHVLSCQPCNNNHGSRLDAHLVQFQKVSDAIAGRGTFDTEMLMNGKRLVTNLSWSPGHKNFDVIKKANDPRVIAAVQQGLRLGQVSDIDLKFRLGYSRTGFQTAALRAAYLIMFKCFGYRYLLQENVQRLRHRISDPRLSTPRLETLIVGVEGSMLPADKSFGLVEGVQIDDIPVTWVALRLKRETIRHLVVFMPVLGVGDERFFSVMERFYDLHGTDRIRVKMKLQQA